MDEQRLNRNKWAQQAVEIPLSCKNARESKVEYRGLGVC